MTGPALVFDQRALRSRLDQLDQKQRAEFALGCAERLLPLYERFHDETGQGDPSVLVAALKAGRSQLTSERASAAELESLADRCQALVPIEDDSWTDLSGLAQNAAAAAAYALRILVSGSVDDAMWAAVQGYEAADLLASTELDVDFNESGVEDRILATDIVQRELAAQDESLGMLERNDRR